MSTTENPAANLDWRSSSFLINVALMPAIFASLALAITSIRPEGPDLFFYSQQAVRNGEWWRMISAHLTHNTWEHFGLNMLGLGILVLLFAQVATWRRWLILFIFSSLFCSIGFYLFQSTHYAYVGMSDVLHGVIVAFAMLDYKHYKLGNIILVLGTLTKVAWEQSPWYIETSAEFIGGPVAIDSHLYGAISGLVLGTIWLLWDRYTLKK